MNDPCPYFLPETPFELIDAQTLFATGNRMRRHFGGLHTCQSGRMLLTFMHGTMPRTNDAGTMIARSDDHGQTWSPPRPLWAVPGWDSFPNGGACQITDDRIRLFIGQYRFTPDAGGKQPFDDGWHTKYIDSIDEGAHWTEPSDDVKIFPSWTEFYGTSNPHKLADGRLLWAVQGTQDRDAEWRVGVSFSDADGDTFSPPLIYAQDPYCQYSDNDIVRLPDGRLLTIFREHMENGTFFSHSADEGQTWTDFRPTGFVGANFRIFILKSGDVCCLYRDEDPSHYGTSIVVSKDGGETWSWVGSLYYQPNSDKHRPGYFCGCPDLVQAADGTLVAVLHTYEDNDGEMCLHLLRMRDTTA